MDNAERKARPSISLPLSEDAKAVLEAVAARTRRSQTQTLGAILEWFESLPERVQDVIVSGGDGAAELVRHRSELAEPESLDGAAAAADEAIHRLVRIAREASNAAKAAAKKK